MRAAILIALLLAATACHRDGPATMVHGNVVDYQRKPVQDFESSKNCEMAKGLLHKQSLGITQYYDCEKKAAVSRH